MRLAHEFVDALLMFISWNISDIMSSSMDDIYINGLVFQGKMKPETPI